MWNLKHAAELTVFERPHLITNPGFAAENVNFPPELLSPANFLEFEGTAVANYEDDNVPARCIGGVYHEVEGRMVASPSVRHVRIVRAPFSSCIYVVVLPLTART
ncbi:hypothetical protein BST61_g11474 [Cercospora zeina]